MSFPRALLTAHIFLLLMIPLTAMGGTSPFLLDYQPTGQVEFGYRFQHPHFSREVDADLLMGFHELSVGMPIRPEVVVRLTLPVVKWGFDTIQEPVDTIELGNVTFAAHFLNLGTNKNMSALVALSLPTVAETPHLSGLGRISHPSVWQTFRSETMTLKAHFNARLPARGESFLRLGIGPEFLVPSGDRSGSTKVLMRYGLGVGVESGRIGASIEFGGYWDTDREGDNFNEDSYHILSAGVEYVGRTVRPALYYQIPTDELYESVIDGVVGVRITVTP